MNDNQYIAHCGVIIHYGVGADNNPPGRGSGRYPKGSGKRPNQHKTGRGVLFLEKAHNKKDKKTGFYLKDKIYTEEQDAQAVNPHYGNPFFRNNCVRCGIAWELRRRGYLVEAKHGMNAIYTEPAIFSCFDGKILVCNVTYKSSNKKLPYDGIPDPKNAKEMQEYKRRIDTAIKNVPDNSRGIMRVSWARNGECLPYGHVVNYYKKNNVFTILDSQNGAKFSGKEDMDYFFQDVLACTMYDLSKAEFNSNKSIKNARKYVK